MTHYRKELHPKFYSDNYDFVLTLYNLNYNVLNKATDMFTQQYPKVPRSSPKLTEQSVIFLKILQKYPEATVNLLAKESCVSDRMEKKYLKELKEQGIIHRIGTNRKGFWEIAEPIN